MKTVAYGFSKDSTLLAFEGPEMPPKDSIATIVIEWKEKMRPLMESALPVVNAEEAGFLIEGSTTLFNEEGQNRLKLLARPGETIPLPGWALEKVLQKRWGTEWHDLPGQTEGREPEGIYRTVCRLKRSEPVKNIPATGELFISESERMKEMKTEPITLTFYSGKLWHSDKTFPKRPFQDREATWTAYSRTWEEYDDSVKDWLSTAYEVVNHHVIMDRVYMQWANDGDQITLPEGYWIEKTDLERLPPILKATITLPEKPNNSPFDLLDKPDNSAHGYTEPYRLLKSKDHEEPFYFDGHVFRNLGRTLVFDTIRNDGDYYTVPTYVRVEPSESQEELIIEFFNDCRRHLNNLEKTNKFLKRMMEKFTITRK